jgi:hypothetical protein
MATNNRGAARTLLPRLFAESSWRGIVSAVREEARVLAIIARQSVVFLGLVAVGSGLVVALAHFH